MVEGTVGHSLSKGSFCSKWYQHSSLSLETRPIPSSIQCEPAGVYCTTTVHWSPFESGHGKWLWYSRSRSDRESAWCRFSFQVVSIVNPSKLGVLDTATIELDNLGCCCTRTACVRRMWSAEVCGEVPGSLGKVAAHTRSRCISPRR